MFDKYREGSFRVYNELRKHFIEHSNELIQIENWAADAVVNTIRKNISVITEDYDAASYLFPFWQNYPPENRGRDPVGDQFPWIEVGEHAIGSNLSRFLASQYTLREIGMPSGPDERCLISDSSIKKLNSITDSVLLFMDIKSVGPRDDFDHTVLSPYQVSGDGHWIKLATGVQNNILQAIGGRAQHDFHAALPPLYVLPSGVVAPTISIFIKPRYDMIYQAGTSKTIGQPLMRITVVTLPNGLLLTQTPNYVKKYPNLFFPGKDDKNKDPRKVRARISFPILRAIAPWRVQTINVR